MSIIHIVIYFFLEQIMTSVMLICYGKMANKKIKLSIKRIILIEIFCLLIVLNNIYNISSFRIIIAIFLWYLINKCAFNDNNKEVFLYTIIYFIISIIIELITSTLLLNHIENIDILNNDIIVKVLFSLINSLILVILFYKLNIADKIKKLKIWWKNRNFYLILLIIVIVFNSIVVLKGNEINNISIIILSVICTLLFIVTINTIINDKYNIKILNEKNESLKDSHKAYSDTIDKYREFKHNLSNDLYAIKSAMPQQYQTQINQIIKKYNKNYEWINKINEIPEGLQGLIYLKIKEAAQEKVQILLNSKKNINATEEDYINLCEILGILIDNARDASKLTKQKIVEINIVDNENELNIKIINTFINDINIDKIGKKNYSTKEYKSGIGLDYIKRLKSNKIKVNFNIINNLFITNIKYSKLNNKSS